MFLALGWGLFPIYLQSNIQIQYVPYQNIVGILYKDKKKKKKNNLKSYGTTEELK